MVPSRDLEQTKSFLIDGLDFEEVMVSPSYIVLTRDGYDLHLCPAGDDMVEMSVYLEVDDLEVTWKKFSPVLHKQIRVREPFDQEYGMREFHVGIPGTKALLFVGQKSG